MTDQCIVEAGSADEALDLQKAQQVLETLCQHYPLHPWQVAFQGRVLVIRHGLISQFCRQVLGRDGVGGVLKHGDAYSASDLAKKAVTGGGELLELFGLKRGAWDGSAPKIPKAWITPGRPTPIATLSRGLKDAHG